MISIITLRNHNQTNINKNEIFSMIYQNLDYLILSDSIHLFVNYILNITSFIKY